MLRTTKLALFALTSLTLALTGCSGDDDTTPPTNPPTNPPTVKPLPDKLVDDIGDRLWRELCEFCNMGPAKRSVAAHDVEDDAPVMLPAAFRVLTESDWMRACRVYGHPAHLPDSPWHQGACRAQ